MFGATSPSWELAGEAHTGIRSDGRLVGAKVQQDHIYGRIQQSVGTIVLARAKLRLGFTDLLRRRFAQPKLRWSPGRDQRDHNVDVARGLACILLVIYHVVGISPQSGLHVSDDSYWRYFADLCVYVRMPLFAFLAGFVYALRPFSADAWKDFLTGKARRLLLPMLIVGTAFAIVQSAVQGTNFNLYSLPRDWTTLHLIPVAHYWFLEALFIIFVIIAVLEWTGALRDRLLMSIVFAAAIIVQLTMVLPPYLSINGAVYLLPYFLVGLAVHRFTIRGMQLAWSAAFIAILGLGYTALALCGNYPVPARESLIALVIGITTSLALVRVGWQNRAVAFIGANAFAIFLFHPFFTASTRMLLKSLHITDVTLLVILSTIAGIAGSVVVGRLALRSSVMRTALLGESFKRSQAIDRPTALHELSSRA